MPNEENLKKGKATQFRSGEEAARNGSTGGKASVAARRKRKAMRAVLNELLTLPARSEDIPIEVSELAPGEVDNQTLMLAQLFRRATGYEYTEIKEKNGDTCEMTTVRKQVPPDVKAVQEIRNILGESRDTAAEKAERKARTEHINASTVLLQARSSDMDPEKAPDDGFLEALEGKAAEDWQQ